MPHLDAGVLHELLDGEIPSTDLPPITAHLAGCPECRARLEEERALVTDVAGLVDTLGIDLPSQAVPERHPAPRRRPAWPRYVAWAATVVIAAGLGYSARSTPVLVAPRDSSGAAPRTTAATDQPLPTAVPPAAAATTSKTADRHTVAARPAPLTVAAAPEVTPPPAPARRDSVAPPINAAEPLANAARESVAGGRLAAGAPVLTGAAAQKVADTNANRLVTQPRSVGALGGGRGGRGGSDALIPRDASTTNSVTVPIDPIAFTDALRRLGGSLRLIDGMVPLRLEVQEPWVRVVYPGDLVLRQQLVDGRIVFELVPPRGFPADSLARLRAKVRE